MALIELGEAPKKSELVDLGNAPITPEQSIMDVNKPDMETLMSDSFDLQSNMDSEQSQSYQQLTKILGQKEVDSEYKTRMALQQLGIDNDDDIKANQAMIKAMIDDNTSSGMFASIQEGWNNGWIQQKILNVAESEMNGTISRTQADEQIQLLRSQLKETKSTGLAGFAKSSANVIPNMMETTTEGFKYGAAVGGTAAGLTALVGQAGPQVALPEEIITVPAAFATFGTMGFAFGTAKRGTELMAAEMYLELMELKDEQGNRIPIDPNVAQVVSGTIGSLSGMLEVVKVGTIIKTIPGGKKLLAKAQQKTIMQLAKNKTIQKALIVNSAKYGGTLATETAVEVGQEVNNIVGDILAVNIQEQIDKTGMTPEAKLDVANRLVSTVMETAKSFALIAAPGHIAQTGLDVASIEKPKTSKTQSSPSGETIAQPKTAAEALGITKEKRVSKIMSSEMIIPRIDVDSLGKTLVDVPAELPANPKAPKLQATTYTKIPLGVNNVITLIVNPNESDYRELSRRFEEQYPNAPKGEAGTRTTKDSKGNKYVWSSSDATHGKVEEAILKIYGVETNQNMEVAAPTKESSKNKVTDLSPEEELQLQQSESTLKAEEGFAITPNLYIGNVTARMKKVMGAEFGVDPEKISGFHEGAFPTKRTKVELSMDEGRSLLNHMENSLQERVDNNQLNTDSDLARANADWGDIKELHRKLGLPKTVRPFRVIREKGTRTVTIENTRERVTKTTKTGALDMVETTKIQQLNDVMRRVAKYAQEGYKTGKKEAKEAYALLQYIRKQKQLREKLIEKITNKPSEEIDFFYREAIKSLQKAIDFKAKTEGAKEKKAAMKSYLEKNPDKAGEIDQDIIDMLDKKNVADLSFSDLTLLNNEITRLRKLGFLKSEMYRNQREKAIANETKAMIANIESAKGISTKVQSVERANALRPMRIFDMLDGGKKFAGRIYNFFYKITNDNYNAELKNIDARQSAMKQKRGELGISIQSLSKKRIIDGFELTVDELLSIYAGWKNPASRAALKYGGIPKMVNGKEVYTELTDALYQKIEDSLTQNERIWGDTIIAEYDQNHSRIRNSVIAAENRDMGKEVNYTKMRRKNIKYLSSEQELIDELALRNFFRLNGPHKAFTIKRKDIPAEFQQPIELGITKIWMQEVSKQEHYINNVLHIKDMQKLAKNEQFRNAVESKFGLSVLDTVDHFIKMNANEDYYKAFSDIEKISKIGRRHTAIAYIGFNLSSVLNQLPSIMSYWVTSSVADVLGSAMSAIQNPRKAYERAKEIHYQVSHQAIEREMEEMNRMDANSYEKIVGAIGDAGMYCLLQMDRTIRVIGINAVYNKAIRDGLSVDEAKAKAAKTTLLTQEASSPKDLAKLYSSNEILNWFTMFTNQLNQIYNISTYDIPAALRSKEYNEAGRSAMSLATMAMMIWMIQTGEIPDEPEDGLQAMSEQFVGSWPIVGSSVVSGFKGWTSPPMFLKPFISASKAARTGYDGDIEGMLVKLIEPLSVGAGLPYQAAKEAYSFIEEAE